jgi:ectoine hydroxylase-related dioxygenase (phytanoyl-CoA dioxygenase family)
MSRLGEVADAEDLRWISGYLSLKEPHSPALRCHQDWWCWDHSTSFATQAPQVAVLCNLDQTEDRNAALRVLPGSHRASASLHAALPKAHAPDADALGPAHPAMRDHPDQLTLRLRAGDAVVIDYRLLHGTHANATGARRDCVLLTSAPSWTSSSARCGVAALLVPQRSQGASSSSFW